LHDDLRISLATAQSWWFLVFRPFFSVDPLATARWFLVVSRFRPFFSVCDAHWWFSGRILACHAGGAGSIPGQCSWLSSWPFFDSTQGRRKIKVSPSGNRTPVSRVTGGDTIHYTNEELVTTFFRGR